MTPAEVAEHLGARPSGPGRWMARCPAHDDRNPSLSISEGDGERVLLHCWAGCDTAEVLAAAGLRWADVCGAATSPADRARLWREREQLQAAERAVQRQMVDVTATAETLRTRTAAMAQRLSASEVGLAPLAGAEADALAAEYHAALDALHEMEAA